MLVTDSRGQDVEERRRDKVTRFLVNLKVTLPRDPPALSKPGQLVTQG